MSKLYPLKFKPILKEKIWGGAKINAILNKEIKNLSNCGESWEISGVQGNISVVDNGFLKGNNLEELVEVYMGDLVGDQIYETYGNEFPLLIKFIDANDVLSIQVHPDDVLAEKRHNAFGKTEMWYVLEAEKNAELISGFNAKIDKKTYLKHLNDKTLKEILNVENVKSGDVFFIPSGRVHAIGAGVLLTEIQQTSDITYRIYDWDRKDASGNLRELHTEHAVDAIDYNYYNNYKTDYKSEINKTSQIVNCKYFTTNIIQFNHPVEKDYISLDSFIIYICIEGNSTILFENDQISVTKGETVLIPAEIKNLTLKPDTETKFLEIFINNLNE